MLRRLATSFRFRGVLQHRGLHSQAFKKEHAATHTCGELGVQHAGQQITLCGWVQSIRKLGSRLLFITLRDRYGVTQLVAQPKLQAAEGTSLSSFLGGSGNASITPRISSLTPECVVCIKGTVNQRPPEMVNSDLSTGAIEVDVQEWHLLNQVGKLPVPSGVDFSELAEDTRLKYRYMDLRNNSQLTSNIVLRSLVSQTIRKTLTDEERFLEVETPTLFKSTPEGAREFLVPTRQIGQFYALPQSPQQFKQLLMAGGIDRYFQIARCYRDETGRADRQPEFTQVDMEMSFVTAKDIQGVIERLISKIWKVALDIEIPTPFTRRTFAEVMTLYGSDKPDTRFDIMLRDMEVSSDLGSKWEVGPIQQALSEDTRAFDYGKRMKGVRLPNAASVFNESRLKELHDLLPNDLPFLVARVGANSRFEKIFETSVAGNVEDAFLEEAASRLFDSKDELSEGDVFVIGAGPHLRVADALGKVRQQGIINLVKSNKIHVDSKRFDFLWVVDFPLFESAEGSDEAAYRTKTGIQCTHHPFTAPNPEDVELFSTDPLKVRGQHYDVVVNGWELGGGSIRIHSPELQKHVFSNVLGHGKQMKQFFAHLLNALEHGCPPHGGIALGFDRMMAILCGAGSIRDVIAFPKSTQGNDLMCIAPDRVERDRLREYNVAVWKADQESKSSVMSE